MDLAGAVVVITGGTGGLGSRICHAFARAGSRVAVVCLERTAVAEALASELVGSGAAASIAVQADVTEPGPIAALVERVVQEWGRLDVLVNNAAFNHYVAYKDLDGLTLELWEKMQRANVTGPWLCSKAVAPVMQRGGRGAIINVGSVAGFSAGGSSIAYAVSKAALAHLTHCLASALAPEVTVNGVAPGLMEGTRITERLHPDLIARSTAEAMLKRPVDKDDVAEQIVAFARSNSTTGQNVIIDSGRIGH
jgi:3-oxoacyl-[acyl-carrier protein] reductase